MIIRLNSDCINKDGRFRFNFFERKRLVYNIYDENLIEFFPDEDRNVDDNRCYNHGGHEVYDDYNGYGSYTGYGSYDDYDDDYDYDDDDDDYDYDDDDDYDEYELSDSYFDRSTRHSFELNKLYLCFFNGNLYELYALRDEDEVVVLFREMNFEFKGNGDYEYIEESLNYEHKFMYDLMGDREISNKCLEDALHADENVQVCAVTDKIYVISCYDGIINPDNSNDNYFFYSLLEGNIKPKYSLDELLEIEKNDKNSLKTDDKVYRKSLLPKSNMK